MIDISSSLGLPLELVYVDDLDAYLYLANENHVLKSAWWSRTDIVGEQHAPNITY